MTMVVVKATPAQQAQLSRPEAATAVAASLCASLPELTAGKLGEGVGEGLTIDCGAFRSPPPSAPASAVAGGGAQSLSGAAEEYVDCTWQWVVAFLCGLLLGLLICWYHRKQLLKDMPQQGNGGAAAGFGAACGGS